jgi:hypothetical protein
VIAAEGNALPEIPLPDSLAAFWCFPFSVDGSKLRIEASARAECYVPDRHC